MRPGVDKRDRGGRTQLHYAALENDVDQARQLLDGGADPNAADRQAMTPLHFAAQQGALAAAKLLLERGANLDAEDSYGNTPLWRAVFQGGGEGDLAVLLRQHGADPLHKNASGQTPANLARLRAAASPDKAQKGRAEG